jgi:alpha-ketoglutarate-dependent taurine dioxygenase
MPFEPILISNIAAMTCYEVAKIIAYVRVFNMAVYQTEREVSPEDLLLFAERFGLHTPSDYKFAEETGVATLQPGLGPETSRPHNNQELDWHTDGYYNSLTHQVHSMIVHCVTPADEGGITSVINHEDAYDMLHAINPEYTKALEADDVYGNTNKGKLANLIWGPVFTKPNGRLHMRYGAYARGEWKDDPVVSAARKALDDILNGPNLNVHTFKMEAGQGIICNNVLHRRTSFEGDQRKLYRVRYEQRLAGT